MYDVRCKTGCKTDVWSASYSSEQAHCPYLVDCKTALSFTRSPKAGFLSEFWRAVVKWENGARTLFPRPHDSFLAPFSHFTTARPRLAQKPRFSDFWWMKELLCSLLLGKGLILETSALHLTFSIKSLFSCVSVTFMFHTILASFSFNVLFNFETFIKYRRWTTCSAVLYEGNLGMFRGFESKSSIKSCFSFWLWRKRKGKHAFYITQLLR